VCCVFDFDVFGPHGLWQPRNVLLRVWRSAGKEEGREHEKKKIRIERQSWIVHGSTSTTATPWAN